MSLEMFRVQVRLVTVWARILPICIFLRNHALCGLATTLRRWVGSTRRTWQDTPSALRPNDMCRLLFALHERGLLSHLTKLAGASKTG